MCLGIPGKVVKTFIEHEVLMGKIDFSGVMKQACLEHVPDVKIGEYVLVHVGFALSKIDEQEARRVFEFLAQMNQLDELDVPSPSPPHFPSAADLADAKNRKVSPEEFAREIPG